MARARLTPLRPLIGITQGLARRRSSWWFARHAILRAGGEPLLLTTERPHYGVTLDGLIIGGGTDVHPDLYRGRPKSDYHYDALRDDMEVRWLEMAMQIRIPTLGICRGAQLLNVVRGGTLHLDIRKVYEKADYPTGTLARIFYRKPVTVVKDSLLYRIIRCRRCRVNSMHTQSVSRLGHDLRITSQEDNGIVQSIEDPRYPMLIGVQFHPEYLIYQRRFQRLFSNLVRLAEERNMEAYV
jgi:putative glutamine amidotransferase